VATIGWNIYYFFFSPLVFSSYICFLRERHCK
jgi:hypothetical protein